MAGLQSDEGRMMIDSVVWAQYVNVTDRQTDRQPRRHSKSSGNTGIPLRFRQAEVAIWSYVNPMTLLHAGLPGVSIALTQIYEY